MAEIRINATGGVKLYDADDSHYAQIVAGTITSNVDAITLGHDVVSIVDNLALTSDSAVLKFGADNDTTLTHTDGTGLTLNSTNKLCFNDASQFIQGSSATVLSIGATDEIDLTATAVDLNGTLNVSGVATFQANPVFPDGGVAIADLDIDGGTDIGAAIVDADLFIVDDGAGGTNRKVTASRIKTYAGGASTIGALTDVTMDATNFVDSFLVQTNTDGSAPGTGTLSSATSNIGIGKNVFEDLTSGTHNTCFGSIAGTDLTTGVNNTFIGEHCGTLVTTGDHNIGIGKLALDNFDTEDNNIGLGYYALSGAIAGGEKNICIGYNAGYLTTSADENVCIGNGAGDSITTGGQNVIIGSRTGDNTTTGSQNTFVGMEAGASGGATENITGTGNTIFGTSSTVSASDSSNECIFGPAGTGKGDQTVLLSKTPYHGGNTTTFSTTSDRRIKKNIVDSPKGLDEINQLRIRNFNYRPVSEIPSELGIKLNPDGSEIYNIEKLITGVIAQETEDIFPEAVVSARRGVLAVDADAINWASVKAIQELSAKIDSLEAKVTALENA